MNQQDELETSIYQNAADRNSWLIFTDDPKRVKEYKAKGLPVVKTVGKGYTFSLKDSQFTIRKIRVAKKV